MCGDPNPYFRCGDPNLYIRCGDPNPYILCGNPNPCIMCGDPNPCIMCGDPNPCIMCGDPNPCIRCGDPNPYIMCGDPNPCIMCGDPNPYITCGDPNPCIRCGDPNPCIMCGDPNPCIIRCGDPNPCIMCGDPNPYIMCGDPNPCIMCGDPNPYIMCGDPNPCIRCGDPNPCIMCGDPNPCRMFRMSAQVWLKIIPLVIWESKLYGLFFLFHRLPRKKFTWSLISNLTARSPVGRGTATRTSIQRLSISWIRFVSVFLWKRCGFFNMIFVSFHMHPENPKGTGRVIVGSMNMGCDIIYIWHCTRSQKLLISPMVFKVKYICYLLLLIISIIGFLGFISWVFNNVLFKISKYATQHLNVHQYVLVGISTNQSHNIYSFFHFSVLLIEILFTTA